MNTHYEWALGTQPSSYGNSGQNPSDPVLVGAFDLLPSQPHSQNTVLNPVVQPKPLGDYFIRYVFDAVLKHGWPSVPYHGASMAEKIKPLQKVGM